MDLEKLFLWKGEITIKDRSGEPVIIRTKPLVLYQRVIGDADLVHARKQALKASRKLRKSLRDQTSDSAASMLPDYESAEPKLLCNMIVMAEALSLRRQATELVSRPKEPKSPKSGATLEDQEKYEAKLEENTKVYLDDINTKIRELMDKRIEELKAMDNKLLPDIFLNATINSLCQAEMLNVFNSWCAYLGTYSDRNITKRAFKAYNSFDNSATELKEQVIRGYLSLEMGGEDLKN